MCSGSLFVDDDVATALTGFTFTEDEDVKKTNFDLAPITANSDVSRNGICGKLKPNCQLLDVCAGSGAGVTKRPVMSTKIFWLLQKGK